MSEYLFCIDTLLCVNWKQGFWRLFVFRHLYFNGLCGAAVLRPFILFMRRSRPPDRGGDAPMPTLSPILEADYAGDCEYLRQIKG